MILLDDVVNILVQPLFNLNNGIEVKNKFTYAKGSKGLCVFIPPWRARSFYYFFIKRQINRKGYSLLEYKIPSSLLSSDYEFTLYHFKNMQQAIKKDISDLRERYGFEQITILGTSLGCVEALMVASDNPLIQKIILIVPGNCLAESVWKGIRTKGLRKSFEKKGIKLDFLKNVWSPLAPENNLVNLEHSDISIHLSKADKVIPYELGARLVNAMQVKGIQPRVFENKRLGHYGTALKYYLFPQIFG